MIYPRSRTDRSSASTDGDTASTGVSASPDFPRLEERVLAFWKADDTFTASVTRNPAGENGANEFVFYDGPPFANGLPHYGHLLTGYVKDVVPRYQTMRGRHVERRFGWDTHGLPAELEAMHQLGLKTKADIEALGVEKFNAACRASVLRYTDEWRAYVTRQARWVDFDHDYKTLEPDYMESVLWAFKTLHDKGLVYEGWRVLPYCWNDETPLSSHELRMDDDVYQVRNDPAVTVGLRLETGELALIWTTTPWTLPSNLAVVVRPDIDYVVVESEFTGRPERYVIAESRIGGYIQELFGAAAAKDPNFDWRRFAVQRLAGADLIGRSYLPPFDYYVGQPNAHRVVAADFVTTSDGTGLVHTAGAFGEEDLAVTDREGIEAVMPVGPDGRFTAPVVEYEGMRVFDANLPIIDDLKARTRGEGGRSVTAGTVLLRHESYAHSYPHCWRCREPLIYKGVSSWFVEVTKFRDRMVELNQDITWVPEHVRDGQFGHWLGGARDWSISRNRYWGTPIPIWKSDDPAYPRLDVYGSIDALETDFGVSVPDLHRPFIDELTRPNPDDPTGKSTMRRVPDVLDVWFDSGSMPYAQVHYPFQNADWFSHHYPGDFIVEYIGQTRGWFYTMHVLATALFDRPAFRSCISHGIVLGSDGQKMSKSLRNYPDVAEVFDRDGADAMRWFLMSSPILRGGNLVVTEQAIRDGVRQVMIPLWNAYSFFTLYANAADGGAGYQARDDRSSAHVLDRYILGKLDQLTAELTTELDALNVAAASEAARGFVEVLSNWYIRRSRDRFWDGDSAGSHAAFDTLFTVLQTTTRLLAPLLPLVTEDIWRGLTGGRSVHLTDWPQVPLTDWPQVPLRQAQGALLQPGTPREPVEGLGTSPEPVEGLGTSPEPVEGLGTSPEPVEGREVLLAVMDRVRAVCSVGSALRKAEGLRVRLPLSSLTVVADDAAMLRPYADLITDELNVVTVELTDLTKADVDAIRVRRVLQVNARAAGPRLGREVQTAIRASKSGDWKVADDGAVVSGGIVLHEGEYALRTEVSDTDAGDQRAVAMLPGGGFVILDTHVTAELAAEGLARDVVRAVQQARRDAGYRVSDRIRLELSGEEEVLVALRGHSGLIAGETLATELQIRDGGVLSGSARTATVGQEQRVLLAVDRV